MTGLPLRERKRFLRRALSFEGPVRYTPHRNERGEKFFREACAKGWEGLIAKRAESTYVHGRSRDWLKLKCSFEQELVIGGFTPPQGARASTSGRCSSATTRTASCVTRAKWGPGSAKRPWPSSAPECRRWRYRSRRFAAAADSRASPAGSSRELVGQFAFGEWTRDGKLRHPRYLGLREDKRPREVVREAPGG